MLLSLKEDQNKAAKKLEGCQNDAFITIYTVEFNKSYKAYCDYQNKIINTSVKNKVDNIEGNRKEIRKGILQIDSS